MRNSVIYLYLFIEHYISFPFVSLYNDNFYAKLLNSISSNTERQVTHIV